MDLYLFSQPRWEWAGDALWCLFCMQYINLTSQVLGGMVYLPAGLLNGQIEFRPTVELWSAGRPAWMMQASTIMNHSLTTEL